MRKHALGIVVKDRWELTQKTLQSLYHSDQLKDSYDLYLIDNGSSPIVAQNMSDWCRSSIVPVKNIIRTKPLGIGPAWNLFLMITRDYLYRTKLDNDLIFANTPVAAQPFERAEIKAARPASPADAGTNPGAIPVASFTMGAGHRVEKRSMLGHTCFLQHAEDAMAESNLGICALPPVPMGKTLQDAMPEIAAYHWRNHPVLLGGCMTITKPTFDRLGYFDERLPRHIDWEYAQRAMGMGINVGYTPHYCVIHIGELTPTMHPSEMQQAELASQMLGSQIEFKRDFVHSKWEKVNKRIITASQKTVTVNLT